jgi:UDP-2-acetamido-2-deoxy-ribo-hexuluronate aminotransferase
LQQRLKARGIPTAVHYPLPLHRQPAYAHLAAGGRFPVAERLAADVISMPMHPDLDDGAIATVAGAVRDALTTGAAA